MKGLRSEHIVPQTTTKVNDEVTKHDTVKGNRH